MVKKSPKRYAIVQNYLLKIWDRGHHDYFYFSHSELSPEDLHYLRQNKLDFGELEQSGRIQIERKNYWDDVLENAGRSNTAYLISRDIKIYRTVENLRTNRNMSTETAIGHLINNWPAELDKPLEYDTVFEFHKRYASIFRSHKVPVKNPDTGKIESWRIEGALRDSAVYALREMMVRTGQYPIDIPTGLLKEIHKMLELPFEKEILKEIEIYQEMRNVAFGVTFTNPDRLFNLSIGNFKLVSENRSERIKTAIATASKKYLIELPKLVEMYSHYRLIEGEENSRDQEKIYEQLQEELKDLL